MIEKSVAISEACLGLTNGRSHEAINLLKREYPFLHHEATPRKCSPEQSTRVFVRDGFIDRYTSERLVFPLVLRVLSTEMPDDFPYHPNWKTGEMHPAYWEIRATIDHLIPVSKEGADDDSNWVTISMARNSAKGNWTLDQLGWSLRAPGSFKEWDGLIYWFLEYTKERPTLIATPWMRQWHLASTTAVSGFNIV